MFSFRWLLIIALLAPGSGTASARTPAGTPITNQAVLRFQDAQDVTVTLPSNETVTIVSAAAGPFRISGIVTDWSTACPFVGAGIVVRDAAGTEVGRATAGEDGGYSIPVPTGGTYPVTINWTDTLGTARQVTIPVVADGSSPDPLLVPNTITGRVYNRANGLPVAGVGLELLHEDNTPVLVGGTPRVATTAADGGYEFVGLPAVVYAVRVTAAPAGFAVGYRIPVLNDIPGETVANTDVPLDPLTPGRARQSAVSYLEISKRADRGLAEIGDLVAYTVTVANRSDTREAREVVVTDDLPPALRYVRGSTLRAGTPAGDPEGSRTLTWRLGALPAGQTVELTYRAAVGAGGATRQTNRAEVAAQTPEGETFGAGPAQATVQLRRNTFVEQSVLWGKVFWDRDGNGRQGGDEPGLGGVAVIMDDGAVALTDAFGKYSIPERTAGLHAARVDAATLPAGSRPGGRGPRFAGDPASQFVTLIAGGSYQADFPVLGTDLTARAKPQEAAPAEKAAPVTAAVPPAVEAAPQDLPSDRVTITRPAAGSVSAVERITVGFQAPINARIEVKVNGNEVPRSQAGRVTTDPPRQVTYYEYVGVPLRVGPNKIEISAFGPDGVEMTDETSVSLVASPSRMRLSATTDSAPANGQAEITLSADARDEWGVPVADGTPITLETPVGEWTTPDADPVRPGLQVRTVGGVATARLRSGASGPATVRAYAESAQAVARVNFLTPRRPLLLVGVLDGQIGGGGFTVRGFGRDGLESEGAAGRLSVFARGSVFGGYDVTAHYDSARSRSDRLFQEFQPERPYPIYGDGSTLFFEAPTSRKLFLGVQKNDLRFLLGDYYTDLVGTEFGAYRRSLYGLRFDKGDERFSLRALASKTEQSVIRDEIPGNGTSGNYFLTRGPVVENSERVLLEVRDRFQPDLVLRSTQLYRYTDYNVNTTQGTLFFKQPVPSRDPDDNPVFIVALYESLLNPREQWVLGARAQTSLSEGLRLGSQWISEEREGGDYQLWEADARWRVSRQLSAEGEFARSDVADRDGSAWRVSATFSPSPRGQMRAYLKQVDKEFENATTSSFDLGLRKYGLSGGYKPGPASSLGFDYYHAKGDQLGTTIDSLSAGLRQRLGGSIGDLRFEQQEVEQATTGQGDQYSILTARVRTPLSRRVGLYVARDQNLSGSSSPIRPTATTVGTDYLLDRRTQAFLRYKRTEAPARDVFLVGTESRFSENGSAYAQYQLGGAINGERNQAIVGLNNRWRLAPGVLGSLALERVRGVGELNDGAHTSLSTSFEYVPKQPFRASAKFEIRDYGGTRQNIWSVAAGGKVSRDWSLLGKYQDFGALNGLGSGFVSGPFSPIRLSGTLLDTNLLLGLAYRPQNQNRWNGLVKYEIQTAFQPLTQASSEAKIHLFSTEANYIASSRLEIYGRAALKRSREDLVSGEAGTDTHLALGRVTYDLDDRWDIRGEFRLLGQDAADLRSRAWALETGYTLPTGLRLGVGYNLSGGRGGALEEGDRWERGLYLRLSAKLRTRTGPAATTASGWRSSPLGWKARENGRDVPGPGAGISSLGGALDTSVLQGSGLPGSGLGGGFDLGRDFGWEPGAAGEGGKR